MAVGAADATLDEALALLGGDWRWLAGDLAAGRCALWLGSAVSRGRLPDLGGLLRGLLADLHAARDAADPRCPYDRALRKLLEMAAVDGVDLDLPAADWPELKPVVDTLWDRYGEVLGVRLKTDRGRTVADFLDLPAKYGGDDLAPDVDHRLIALLVEEGVVREIYSGNWDGLVEAAHRCCRGERAATLQVVARPDEVAVDRPDGPVLFKFHGCAVLASRDRERYEPYLVATARGLLTWNELPEGAQFRDAMRHAIRTRPGVFVGLSAQDVNLQAVFLGAGRGMEDAWRHDRPRAVFAKPELDAHQHGVLESLHGDAYRDDPDPLDHLAALPLFSKPFFGALWVHVLLAKVEALVEHQATLEPGPASELARDAPARLGEALRRRFDALPPATRWHELARRVPPVLTRLVSLYRAEPPPAHAEVYRPAVPDPVDRLRDDPNLRAACFDRLVAVLAILARLARDRGWSLEPSSADGPGGGMVVLRHGGAAVVVFVLQAAWGRGQLRSAGLLDAEPGADVVLIHVQGTAPAPRPATPRTHYPGVDTRRGPTEIWFEELTAPGVDPVEGLRRRLPPLGGARPW